ncbi:MAG: DUF2141 domain-containing protein [Pseudomonadota bacterium]
MPLLIGAAPVATLTVEIAGLRSEKGMLRFCVASQPEQFPDCRKGGTTITRTVPAATRTIRFDAMAPGTYAVAVIHDENGNSRLDTFVGIPREGFGFSRNPGIGFGPPRFSRAGFAVEAGEVHQRVTIRYLL